jgi:hypothetical protein
MLTLLTDKIIYKASNLMSINYYGTFLIIINHFQNYAP